MSTMRPQGYSPYQRGARLRTVNSRHGDLSPKKRRLPLPKLIVSNRLSKRAAKITNEEVQAIVENANEENLSIRSLMAKQESNVIITDPREYQLELFEKAKKQNIIAVLDTG